MIIAHHYHYHYKSLLFDLTIPASSLRNSCVPDVPSKSAHRTADRQVPQVPQSGGLLRLGLLNFMTSAEPVVSPKAGTCRNIRCLCVIGFLSVWAEYPIGLRCLGKKSHTTQGLFNVARLALGMKNDGPLLFSSSRDSMKTSNTAWRNVNIRSSQRVYVILLYTLMSM